MKKVLFVINTMGRAGAEKSLTQLMKVLDTNRFELHLLVLINRGEMFLEVPDYVKIHNARPDSRSVLTARGLLVKSVLRSLLKNWNFLRQFPYLMRVLQEQKSRGRIQFDKLFWKIISDAAPKLQEQFDVAIAYLEGGAAYYVADHVKADKKVAFIHIDYSKAGYTPYMDHGCYDRMNRIYVVSEDAKKSFETIYPMYQPKLELFQNIINKDAILSLSEAECGFTDKFEGFRILTIARLHYQKAIDLAISVLYKLKKQGFPVKWYVIGEGVERPELEKKIREYRLTDDFILLGAKSNPYPYLRECDLYVHATRFEGKSIAIQEAQVLGKAIIVSDCSGNREQIRDGMNGLIIKLDQKELAQAILTVLNDRKLKGRLEQESSKLNFSYKEQLEHIYEFIEK